MVCGGGCHVTPCLSSRPFCGNPRTIPQKKSQAVVNPVESHVCFELTFFLACQQFSPGGSGGRKKGVTKTGGDDNHFLIFVPLSSDFCREVLWGRQPSTITQCAGKNVGRGINFSTFVQFSVRPLETCINPPPSRMKPGCFAVLWFWLHLGSRISGHPSCARNALATIGNLICHCVEAGDKNVALLVKLLSLI